MMLFIMVFLPMLAALLCYPLCRRSEQAGIRLVLGTTVLVFLMALALLFLPEQAGDFGAFCGIGIHFRGGNLRSVMALLAAFMWLMTALASPEYFEGARANARYFMFYLWTLGALLGVFLAEDLLTLFLFFEIMSFTSYVWVVQNETPEAIRASETYLFIAVIGGLTMLMGLFLLQNACGTLQLENLLEKAPDMSMKLRFTVGVCLLVGFGAKAGMFPLHIWLPKAHPVAPAPASALLSGILTKSGIFGVIAVSCWLFDGVNNWGILLLIPAVITMVLGAVLAVFSIDLKRTLACSSMSQIGFILTGISMCVLLGEEGAIASCGTVLHVLNHSLIKLTLFVAAGVVYFNVHSLDLNDVRGFGRDKPLLKLAFLSGACSIAGIPGFGGYISKTLLHESIVEYCTELAVHGHPVAAFRAVEWLFLLSGGLTLAYMARLFYILFLAEKPAHQHQKQGCYMSPMTGTVLAVGGLLMPLLGLLPYATMDRIAAFAIPFFHREPMHHAVHYFSLTNLKGAFISITIGALVFFFVGVKLLTKKEAGKEQYRNIWPKKLDLENSFYRPALRVLSFAGGMVARLVETAGALLIFGTVDLIFLGAKDKVVPPEDEQFSIYRHRSERSRVDRSFSADLLCAAFGILALLLLAGWNMLH